MIVDSRGRDVVRDTLGGDFHGPAIVDGWKVYSYLTIIQRCWAFLRRYMDNLIRCVVYAGCSLMAHGCTPLAGRVAVLPVF